MKRSKFEEARSQEGLHSVTIRTVDVVPTDLGRLLQLSGVFVNMSDNHFNPVRSGDGLQLPGFVL